jgi:dihydrofolate reductase
MLDFARIWQAADKIVYSRTLRTVSTSRTRLERAFDSKAVRKLKADASRDVAIGGPALAANAIRAGLVDEYHMFVAPIIVGGGHHYLPGKVRIELDLMDQRRFANGMALLRYRARS